ncbi:unnamed protein product [Notodromas monacha]|uniref:Actin maturation protease n=1 Tax=Notodromas monacha TaxID=399045 RepID=A0A7R9C2L9_9CRUS|nr:unnamed protein product [Notodromas monacha]CAG0925178.1 unnamed protein product [Notodromas monacha]
MIPGSSDVVHHQPERTWLLALHGKSCHVQVWQYADFLESNLNLSEISPEKADYCVPDGGIEEGLKEGGNSPAWTTWTEDFYSIRKKGVHLLDILRKQASSMDPLDRRYTLHQEEWGSSFAARTSYNLLHVLAFYCV